MHAIVVGAGPTGLFCAIALARRGHRVTVVDRDPAAAVGAVAAQGSDAVRARSHLSRTGHRRAACQMPDAVDALTASGAQIAAGPTGHTVALLCRRSTFERALSGMAARQAGVTRVVGTVERPYRPGSRVHGVVTGGRVLTGDVVIDARAGPRDTCGDCGRRPRAATAAPSTPRGSTVCTPVRNRGR